MKKNAGIIILITILSNIMGYSREIILAYFYGTSHISDAYLIANMIPTVIFGFIIGGLSIGFIPIYEKIKHEEDSVSSNIFTSNILNFILVLCTLIIIVVLIFTKEIVYLFASGFNEDTLRLTVLFTRITVIGIYFTALVTILTGFLQSNKNFIISLIGGFPKNAVLIVSVYLSVTGNIVWLPLGVLIAGMTHYLFILPAIRTNKFRYTLTLSLKDKHTVELFRMAMPVLFGASFGQINIMVERTLASHIVVGGISALNYANVLNVFIQNVFVISIVSLLYPAVSRMAASGNLEAIKTSLQQSVIQISLLLIPASFGLLMFSSEIVGLLYGRGAFDSTAVDLTSTALFFYAVGIIFVGLKYTADRIFYAMRDSKTPIKNSIVGVLVNIFLSILLSRLLGIGGLALAASISAFLTSMLMFIALTRKIGDLRLHTRLKPFVKIVISSGIMLLLTKGVFHLLISVVNGHVALLVSVFVGAIVYMLLMQLMKVEEFANLVRISKKKISTSSKGG